MSATSMELEFISKLGLWRDGYQAASDPIKLLKSYIDTAEDRDWGNIDKAAAIESAEKRLKLLQRMREM